MQVHRRLAFLLAAALALGACGKEDAPVDPGPAAKAAETKNQDLYLIGRIQINKAFA